MAQTSAATSVLKLYQLVIEDVVANVREAFLDEGVDELVLQEMKHIWTNRLMASKAVEATPDPPQPSQAQPNLLANNPKTNGTKAKKAEQKAAVVGTMNGNSKLHSAVPPLAAASKTIVTKREPTQSTAAASSQQPEPPAPAPPTIQDPNKLIPIQITLPPSSQNETANRVLTIKVPAVAITGTTLQQAITGEIIASIMPLQTNVAAAVLQQHVTSVLTAKGILKVSSQVDGTHGDSSDEEGSDISDDHFDDIDDDDINKDDEASDIDNDATAEEEPLNSEDDVTDEDNADLFETENVIVCQYDKINRSRNKWKFYLKDGIMNIGGKDYVFQKSNGDAEW